MPNIGIVYQHRPLVGWVEATEQAQQGRLAGANPPYDGKPLSSIQLKIDVRQNGFGLFLINEGHVAKFNVTLDGRTSNLLGALLLL